MKKFKLKEETMPYALDDKGRIGIDNEDVIDNINSLLTGVTSKSFTTPSNALEKIRKVLANFHIHLPKYAFDEGDDDYAVFEISQFGLKAGMTNDGQFVKNTDEKYYLYFEYKVNEVGNYAIFSEIVDEDDLSELINDRESEADDEKEDTEAYSHTQETDHAINKDEHKGLRYTMSEDAQPKKGRPSQRHPLEGHEYHKKSDAELIYIGKDAHKAAAAMKSHNPQAEAKYADQANDAATVRHWRKNNGMPNWYKKKYGHDKKPSTLKEHLVSRGWKLLND